ncbi:MAG: glycoside hydrolase [Anaerolineales bacterium]|nr:glycoside hydrolase [Anaerolineales bacterium]
MKYRTRHRYIDIFLHLSLVLAFLQGGVVSAATRKQESIEWSVEQISQAEEDANTPAIVVDIAGGVHVFWSEGDFGGKRSALLYARLLDGMWSLTDILVGNEISNTDVVLDEEGVFHLVWAEESEILYSSAFYDEALRPQAWSKPVRLVAGPCYHPQIAMDRAGNLHTAFACFAEEATIEHMRSVDGGSSWSRQIVYSVHSDDRAADRPRFALAEDGTLHMVWGEVSKPTYYGGAGVYYSKSEDDGVTWSSPHRLDFIAGSEEELGAWQASIRAFGESEVHVIWNSHSEGGRRYHQFSLNNGDTWSDPNPIWDTFVSQTGPNPMISDSDGTLYLFSAGTFDWNLPQGVYFSLWTGEEWETPQLIHEDINQPHWLDVGITNGRRVHITWEAREQYPRGVWYASGEVEAKYLPSGELPVKTPTPLIELNITQTPPRVEQPSLTPTIEITKEFFQEPETSKPKSISTILVVSALRSVLIPIGTKQIIGILRKR